jgi:hypothetical protein
LRNFALLLKIFLETTLVLVNFKMR